MTKPFAASAFRAYASFTVPETDRAVDGFGYTDAAPRGGAGPSRWIDDIDWHGGPRGHLFGLAGLGLIDHPGFARFTAATQVEVAATTIEAAKVAAPSFAEAKAVDDGETALLDDIKDGPTDPGPGTYYVLDAQEGDSAHSQVDAPGDQDWFLVELSGGQGYKFTLTPDDQTGNPGSPDLLITIYDSAGNMIGSVYDSGSFGATETATFTPTADGVYYVAVSGWTPADIGGYTITAEINNTGGPTGGTPLAAINWGGDANIVDTDGVTTPQGQVVIHVYFSQTGDAPYGSPDDPVVGTTWDAFAKDAAFAAFACYENIINVKFVEVATQAEADFIMAATPTAPVILGRMRPPGEPNEGLGEFNTLASSWSEEGLAQGGYGFITLIHELGHAMGLAHPHDTGGGSEVMHGVEGDLATGYTYGDFDLNQGIWTTMSYNDGWQTAPHGNTDGGDAYGYQGTLMALDVAMLQIKYGANTTYNSTDTVYALPTINESGTFYSCIWDTGGTDWIIAGAGVDCVIDLRPATIQYESGGGGFVSYAANIYGGFTIAQGVVIENAIGGAGDDVITGNTAANYLIGGLGNDTIVGGDGDDRLEGGTDNDSLDGGNGFDFADYIYATVGVTVNLAIVVAQNTGEGSDTLANVEGIMGSDFNDLLIGSSGDNTLQGNAGDDTLRGGDGNDSLQGGDGADTADYSTAGAGVTVLLWQTEAQNTVGAGTDTLAGIENLTGSAFGDSLTGTVGVNVINGGAGADTIAAKAGADTLNGGDGADKIYGEGDNDTLNGDAGDDTLTGGLGADAFNGGSGADTAYYGLATAGVGLNLTTGVHTGEALGDTFSSIEKFRLSNHNDTFVGSASADTSVEGLGGDDQLDGAGGDDTLRGGAGVDTVGGGDGVDRLYGDAGDDTVNGGLGDDFAYGGADNDTVNGDDGVDSLYGEAGNDSLNGGLGDDVLYGGVGADAMNGGDGTDIASYRYLTSAITLNLSTGVHTGEATGDTFTSVERFFMTNFDDTFTGSGSAERVEGFDGNDTLNGGGGGDTMNGSVGTDTLNGDDGNDTLFGGTQNDALNGGAGIDKLLGEAGHDTLTGGTGNDQFYYNAMGFGNDTVTDFVNGQDKIRVVGVAGWDDFSDVVVSSNGSGWAVITFSDGSTITLTGVVVGDVDASDFLWG